MNANSDPWPDSYVKPKIQIIALAASAGGLKALTILLSALPYDFPLPLVIVQHLSPHQPSMMADILRRKIMLPVTQAEEGDALQPGHVYLAPPGKHLLVTTQQILSLTGTEKVHHVRPSADVLFESVAACFGQNSIAVILTGGDGDGAAGILAVKRAGGITIAQDEASSESFSMPRTAIETGAVDYILPLEAITPMLMSLVCG